MERRNTYHTKFRATCPNNGVAINYDLVVESRQTIMVEEIVSEVEAIGSGYHEVIADRLYRRFGGRQILVAHHHGVDITSIRSGSGGYFREAVAWVSGRLRGPLDVSHRAGTARGV